MSEGLLRPTIERMPDTRPPWRLSSQLFVAFFGGALAATVIGTLNAARLGVAPGKRRLIVAIGVLAIVAELTIVVLVPRTLDDSAVRLIMRAFALAAYAAHARLQRSHDRAFTLRGGEHSSLWGPGLAAVFGCGVVEGITAYVLRETL